MLTSAVLLLLTAALIFHYRSSILIPITIFCMLFGALAELFAVHNGAWAYSVSNFFDIPIWLFILWGNAGLFIYRTAIEFERLGFHK